MASIIVTYKGRQYRQLFRGKTKVGPDQCKLQFMDGTKEFWVPGALVSGAPPSAASIKKKRRVCAECGRGGTLVEDLEDGLLKHYGCCDIPGG